MPLINESGIFGSMAISLMGKDKGAGGAEPHPPPRARPVQKARRRLRVIGDMET